MEIIKLKNGEIRFREMIWTNNSPLKSPLFKRKTDCKQWLAIQKANKTSRLLHGENTNLNKKISLKDYCEQWLQTKQSHNVARSSFCNYQSYIKNHIIPFFKTVDLKLIQKNDIERFQIVLSEKHNAKGTNVIMTVLKAIFKEAIKEGYLNRSPCEFIRSKSGNSSYDVFWTKDEIQQFLKANYGHELYDLFMVAINTGLRKGELAGLCWDRVNFNDCTITITRTRDRHELKERTKTNLIRVIPMNDIVKQTLHNIFLSRKSDIKFVFLRNDGAPINPHHIYRLFEVAQRKAELSRKIRFHDLRHTFASQYIINGGNIYDLQKFLGHTDIQMTTRYAHHSMEYLHKAMSGFSLGSVRQEVSENAEKTLLKAVNY